jgi:hypothetical protein
MLSLENGKARVMMRRRVHVHERENESKKKKKEDRCNTHSASEDPCSVGLPVTAIQKFLFFRASFCVATSKMGKNITTRAANAMTLLGLRSIRL